MLQELKSKRQWVVASCAGNKIPLRVDNLRPASVNDPSGWGTYAEAKAKGELVGIVLTPELNVTVIDIDHIETEPSNLKDFLLEEFQDTYRERSVNGDGAHVFLRGQVPRGVRRGDIEIYPHGRYIIVTEDKLGETTELAEGGDRLWKLFNFVSDSHLPGPDDPEPEERPETMDDKTVLAKIRTAANWEKFDTLWAGRWEGHYPSQSEADAALIAFLEFHSGNDAQVMRLFRKSALGKRKKATDAYIARTLRNIRRKDYVPPVDINLLPDRIVDTQPDVLSFGRVRPPAGLCEAIARFVYRNAPKPKAEVAMMAGIGMVAGLAGRSYNVNGMGLSLYLTVVGPTGIGKNAANTGIQKLFAAVEGRGIKGVETFMGPGSFASGAGLLRSLGEQPCMLSLMGEIGHWLRRITDRRANVNDINMREILMDASTKTGADNKIFGKSYSDFLKNAPSVLSPNLTIVGDTTHEVFGGLLDADAIREGFMGRLTVVFIDDPKIPKLSLRREPPDEGMLDELCEFVKNCLERQPDFNGGTQNTTYDIGMTDEAQAFFLKTAHEVDRICERLESSSIIRSLSVRSAEKCLRLAGVSAVSRDWRTPVIGVPDLQWAKSFVDAESAAVMRLVNSGNSAQGTDDGTLWRIIVSLCDEWFAAPRKKRISYVRSTALVDQEKAVPMAYLAIRAQSRKAFRDHKLGSTQALHNAVHGMVNAGLLDMTEVGRASCVATTPIARRFQTEA